MKEIPIDQIAPGFALLDLQGNIVALSDYRGRPVLIIFWSAECPQSELADHLLSDLDSALVMLRVASNANETVDLLDQVAKQRKLPLVLHDPGQQVARMYGAQTTPHFFLMDANGALRYRGALDDRSFRKRLPERMYLREAVRAVLAGQPAPLAETPPFGCTIVFEAEELE